MKKILALILALTMVVCFALTSCTAEKNDNNDNNNDSNNGLALEETDLFLYNTALEEALEEFEPKDELDKEILATINGLPISAAAVRYTTMVVKAPSVGSMSDEEIKTEIENFYKENAALVDFAFKNGVELEEKDITAIKANITGMQLQLGEEYETIFEEYPFTKFFYFSQTALYQTLYSKVYEQFMADTESDITKKALEETRKYGEENDYIRAKHILIQFPEGENEDGSLTDAQKAETLAKANEVLNKVNAMASEDEFDALVAEYNEDPGMQSYPEGYYFGKGEMVKPFEDAAYALEEGKTSGLVETDFGYHIIQRLPVTDEVIKNGNAYTSLFGEALYEELSKDADSYEIVYADNHDERVADFMAEYEELMAEEETEVPAEESSEEPSEETAE